MVGQNVGKYKILDKIGRGGMGTVYRAVDETLHRDVAIKVLNAELNDPEVAKRFRAEAITVARVPAARASGDPPRRPEGKACMFVSYPVFRGFFRLCFGGC